MNLIPIPDDPASKIFSRIVSESGNVVTGVRAVEFGYRVQAGFAEEQEPVIDWDCGESAALVESMQTAIVLILSSRTDDRSCFDGIPARSNVEPCGDDLEFQKRITAIVIQDDRITLTEEAKPC